MSHYSSSPRKAYVILHHTAGAFDSVNRCYFDSGTYDFSVGRNGRIFVCAHSSGQAYWRRSWGAHAGPCNDKIGIVMNGCFGCGGSHPTWPTGAQECAVAFLLSHLGTPGGHTRLRPHARCKATKCPGETFTKNGDPTTKWNRNGVTLRDRIRSRRRNWDSNSCCHPAGDPRCPV